MAVSIVTYTGDGSTSQYIITFDYIDRTHVSATVGGTAAAFTFINDTTIQFTTAPASAAEVKLVRQTPVAALVDFTDGSTLFEADLDLAHRQNRLLAEESRDRADNAITTLNNNITNINTAAASDVAINTVAAAIANVNDVATNMAEVLLADTNAATATTKASEASVSATTASTQAGISTTQAGIATAQAGISTTKAGEAAASASSASGSAATATTQANLATTNGAAQVSLAANQVALATTQSGLATTKAGEAATSASTATTQANTATTQAGIATTKAGEVAASAASIAGAETNSAASASAAAGSATSAANSAASAAAALDNFEDKYLGSLSSEPTVDLDGNALVAGALYFSQTSSSMQVYDGANWIAASSAGVASLNLFEYTATAGQTTFTGNDDNSAAMSYIVGNNIVALNGVILDPSDFSDASGLSIVLTAGATVGDLLNVYAFKSFTVADTVSKTSGGTFNADVTVNGTLTASEVSVSKINDANGDDALTITSNSTVQVHNEIEFIGAAGLNAHIQKNASSGRDELQIYSATDANGAGSRGAGMQLYGNSDNEHSGNVAFITGPDDGGEGRMFVSGWDTNTHVTIGNGPTGQTIWQFVDSQNDKALLNLINPTGGPALFIMEASGSTEGDITVNDGESLHFGHWNYGTSTYTHRMAMTPSGLDVVGGITAGGDVTFDTTTLHVDSTNGRVGIGTTTPTNQLNIEDTGDVKVVLKTTGTGDADATLVLDSADTGESVLQFEHDGVYGAKVEWFTDGGPDLNIITVGVASVIDMQPNGVRTGRFDVNGLEVTGTVAATSYTGDGSALTGIAGTPAGAVIYHAANAPPTGFIKANGASLSTTTYADLFAAIGYTFGGSGSSFNVPDLRGEFMRGWDDSRGIDSGRSFGSSQTDAVKDHEHRVFRSGVHGDFNAFSSNLYRGHAYNEWGQGSVANSGRSGPMYSGGGQVETRPRNIALLACIKY